MSVVGEASFVAGLRFDDTDKDDTRSYSYTSTFLSDSMYVTCYIHVQVTGNRSSFNKKKQKTDSS